MGVGTVEDISHAIENGFDMFDCVAPTRLGRHGHAITENGVINIKNAKYREDFTPLSEELDAFPKKFTKAYLHHLIREKEMLGGIIIGLHNILWLHKLTQDMRNDILENGEELG